MNYYYGITRRDITVKNKLLGIEGCPVVTEPHKYINFIMSRISAGKTIVPSNKNVLKHAEVIESFFNRGPVIPFRFGAVCEEGKSLSSLFNLSSEQLIEELSRLEGAAEFGIKVEISKSRNQNGSGKEYLLEKYRMSKRYQEVGEEITLALDGLIEGVQMNDAPDDRCTGGYQFLVRKEKINAFMNKTEKLKVHEHFYVTGPWPPYNFCKLEVKHV